MLWDTVHDLIKALRCIIDFCSGSFACAGSAALRFFALGYKSNVALSHEEEAEEGDNASPTRHGRMHGSDSSIRNGG